MTQLEKLQLDYETYRWNYERCHQFNKDTYWKKMQVCLEKMKNYKLENSPELLEQPKHNIKPISFVPMDTWCEEFENYNF